MIPSKRASAGATRRTSPSNGASTALVNVRVGDRWAMADLLMTWHASLGSTGSVTRVTGLAICSFCLPKGGKAFISLRPPFFPRGDNSHGQWSLGYSQNEENMTRHEAEPASSGRSLPRPSMRRTQQWIQTTMQIYASAARLRSSGAHSYMRHESQRLWRATATSGRFLADRRSEAPVPPKANDLFLPVLILRYLIYFANLKPSGIT